MILIAAHKCLALIIRFHFLEERNLVIHGYNMFMRSAMSASQITSRLNFRMTSLDSVYWKTYLDFLISPNLNAKTSCSMPKPLLFNLHEHVALPDAALVIRYVTPLCSDRKNDSSEHLVTRFPPKKVS